VLLDGAQQRLSVGYLAISRRSISADIERAFLRGLTEAGFDDGRNVTIDYRYAEGQPERLIEAEWGKGEGSYAVEIGVTATDRRGLLRDIGDALAREKINVTAVRTQSRDDLAFMRFSFDVTNMAQLKRALAQVRQVKGVIRAARG